MLGVRHGHIVDAAVVLDAEGHGAEEGGVGQEARRRRLGVRRGLGVDVMFAVERGGLDEEAAGVSADRLRERKKYKLESNFG